MRSLVGRILTDRFWQAGISEGSKDDFYARVLEKKHTFEGLASTIRGTIRFVRESCYAIIYCMTRLDTQFYGFSELPGPLSHALLADASSLSAHQLINLLNLVRYLVDNCPVPLRDHFLPPILEACFRQMDARVNGEWARLDQQQVVKSAGEDLTEEMKTESILRQLTYTSVMLVADFLDPARKNATTRPPQSGGLPATAVSKEESDRSWQNYPSLRNFCLMHSSIAEPLFIFCTHVIRMRDSRCCSIMLRILKTIVPEFGPSVPQPPGPGGADTAGEDKPHGPWVPANTAAAIREYISTEIVRACVTSLHEPYFVELQKDLASLVATIVVSYSNISTTARDILVSLPGMRADDVDKGIEFMRRSSPRAQRSVMLELLRDLKGVSISEMGKISKSVGFAPSQPSSRKTTRSRLAQKFMTAPEPTNRGTVGASTEPAGNGNTDVIDGIAGLFEI